MHTSKDYKLIALVNLMLVKPLRDGLPLRKELLPASPSRDLAELEFRVYRV